MNTVLDPRADIPTVPLETPDAWCGADLAGRAE